MLRRKYASREIGSSTFCQILRLPSEAQLHINEQPRLCHNNFKGAWSTSSRQSVATALRLTGFRGLDTHDKCLDAVSIWLILCKHIDEFRLQKNVVFDKEDSLLTRCVERTTETNPLNSKRIDAASAGTGAKARAAFTMIDPSGAYQICQALPAGQEKSKVTGEIYPNIIK
jgi:hypothetical protein